MNKIRIILIAVVVYILLTIISFSFGWWIIGLALIVGGGFILYRISGPSVGITQLDFLKKIPGNKSWWTYGLVTFSTLYYVLLGFGVIKWEWVQFNVLMMLLIIALSNVLAGSKDISSSLQGVMKLWTVLSIVGIVILIIATRFSPELVQNLDYSHSSTPPTEQSAGQEQVNPSLSPTPTPEVWDSTQFSDRGGIILRRAKGFVVVSPESEICMSDFRDSDGAGFIQRVSLIKAGEEERVFSTRESRCWDISEGEYTYRVGDSVSAEIHEYIKYKGRFPVIRPK